jgi:hypothetical protein
VKIKLATVALVALMLAGCSSTPEETSGTATATTRATKRTKAVRFSQCMRDHGVKDFPDPDASGELTIDGVLNGSSLDADSPAWKQAMRECKDLQPSGFTGHKRTAAQQKPALAFAQCIREHGVKDFPDPTADGPLVDTNRIPSSNQPGGMEILNAAMKQCGELAQKAIGDR